MRRLGGVLSWRIWDLCAHVVVVAAANSMAAGAIVAGYFLVSLSPPIN
jgi:hypothetical protein